MLPRGLNGKSGLQEGLQVQVWAVRLEASEQRFSDCSSWLSHDETARAARFHFEEHRRAFVLGRGVLRAILGGILETPPGQILFSYGPKGKPGLADPNSPLRFNVSNSGDLAVFCLAEGCDIGIDVEQVRPIPDMDRIAARFFAPEEASELMGLPEADRPRGFFNCWTRKEAYIKAVGDGLWFRWIVFKSRFGQAIARRCCLWEAGPRRPAAGRCMGSHLRPNSLPQSLIRAVRDEWRFSP